MFKGLLSLLVCFIGTAAGAQPLDNYGTYTYPLPDSLLHPLLKYDATARKSRDFETLEKTTEYLTHHYQLVGNYNEAFTIADRYMETAVQTGDSALIPAAHYYTGKLYYGLGMLDISLEYFLKMTAYSLSREEQCRVFYAIAEVSRNLNDLSEKTMEYYRKSEEIARQLNDSSRIAQALFGESQMYFNSLGIFKHCKEELRAGMRDSLELSTRLLTEGLDYCPTMEVLYLGLGLNYAGAGDFEKAEEYGKKGLELTGKVPDLVPIGLNTMASILICNGDYEEAIRLCKESYAYSENWDKKGDMANAAEALHYIYKQQHRYKEALEAYETLFRLNTATRDEEKKIAMAAMQVQFELKLKEEHLQYEKKRYRQTLLFVSSALTASVLLLIVFIYMYRKKREAFRELVRKSQEWAHGDEPKKEKSQEPVRETQEVSQNHHTLMRELYRLLDIEKIFTDSELTLTSLAEKLGTNRSYLSEAVNRTTGKRFSMLINEYRVKEAVKILSQPKNDKYSLDMVAGRAGFANRQTFYETFKKMTGLSPSDFKKNRDATG